MDSVARSVDNCVEAALSRHGVVDGEDGAVGLHQGVLSLGVVAVSLLVVGFFVAGVSVFYTVVEFVFRGGLNKEKYI